jgi:hypothetical protein
MVSVAIFLPQDPAREGKSVGKTVANSARSFVHTLIDHNPSGLRPESHSEDMIIATALGATGMAGALL